MNKFATLTLGALGLVTLASGCMVDTGEVAQEEEVGSNQEALVCSNDQATFAVMASMAAAAAGDFKRWLPMRDLQWNTTTQKLEISSPGRDRCWNGQYDANGKKIKKCTAMDAWLALQYLTQDQAQGMQFGGSQLDVGVLNSRLASYWNRQEVCASRPDNGQADNCPWDRHDLVFSSMVVGANTCAGGMDYWYHAYYGDSCPASTALPGSTGTACVNLSPTDAGQLKNQLLWAGGTDNPFLAFDSVNGNVKVDPLDTPGSGGGSGSGSCLGAPNYNGTKCDAVTTAQAQGAPPNPYASVATGQCCVCGTGSKTWQPKSGAASWYVCK